jgi:hypothetical protein
MKIVRIIIPSAMLIFLIGYSKELRHSINEGGWSGWAVVLICFCITLLPIATKIRAGLKAGTETAAQIARTSRRSRLAKVSDGKVARLAGAFSARALLCGALQLDRNGFEATLLSRKQYLWTEVSDFRTSSSGVRFNVVGPRLWFASSKGALGDNYGLKAEELADLMESWQSAALDDERLLAPAVSE